MAAIISTSKSSDPNYSVRHVLREQAKACASMAQLQPYLISAADDDDKPIERLSACRAALELS